MLGWYRAPLSVLSRLPITANSATVGLAHVPGLSALSAGLRQGRLNSPVAFIYSTIGGIIGVVATHYVSNVRDRRAARALVIEQVGRIEMFYASTRVALSDNPVDIAPLPRIDELLGALEGAALMASIPRIYLQFYANMTRINYECRRLEGAADRLTLRVIQHLPTIIEHDKNLDPAKAWEYVQQVIDIAKGLRQVADDERLEDVRQSALRLLRIALWHPLIVQLLRRKVSQMDSTVKKLDEWRTRLESLNKKLEGKVNLTSYIEAHIDSKLGPNSR